MTEIDPLAGKIACSISATGEAIDRKTTTVYDLIERGELETYLDGRSRKVVAASIRAYIERRRAGIPLNPRKATGGPAAEYEPEPPAKHRPAGRPRKHPASGPGVAP
jgi:hypothetical protein